MPLKPRSRIARAFDWLVDLGERRLTWEAVEFRSIYGMTVPTRPWPTVFYVSRDVVYSSSVEVRKLTPLGLLRGMARNAVSDAVYLFCRVAYAAGFLDLPMWETPSARFWRWDFWRVRAERRNVAAMAAKEARWEAEAREAWERLVIPGVWKLP